MAKQLTRTQWWLKQHQITAFWHGFGISNGLQIPKEETKEVYTTRAGTFIDHPSPGGRTYIEVNKQYMLKLLKEYIRWLKSYKEDWNTDRFEDSPVKNESDFIKAEGYYPERLDIYEMIKLLQDVNDSGKHLGKGPIKIAKLIKRYPEKETGYDKKLEKEYWSFEWADGTKGEGSLYQSQIQSVKEAYTKKHL